MIVDLSPVHVRDNLAAYIAVSSDVSDWRENHFLSDLPDKWVLSFALWGSAPVAYCIMSRKFGPPHIHQFMVRKDRRGTRIGAEMLEIAEKRGAATLKVDQENAGAIRFYERHGWTIFTTGPYLWLRAPQAAAQASAAAVERRSPLS